MRALASMVFVAAVIGLALGAIFWPLMRYERAMQNEEVYRTLIGSWVGTDLILSIFLCRRDLLDWIRRH